MLRMLSVAAAAAATLMLTSAAGFAQAPHGYYAAIPASMPAKSSVITRTTIWRCEDNACVAAKSGSRDAIMCQLIASEVGRLTGFTANGKDFDADELAKCNARAH